METKQYKEQAIPLVTVDPDTKSSIVSYRADVKCRRIEDD